MRALHVVQVVGARPQLVKAAAISRAIERETEAQGRRILRETVIHTGQHYDFDMSGVFLRDLQMTKPSFDLGVGSAPHGWQTGEMLKRLEPILADIEPDVVLVAGDTNSTLSAALCSAKLGLSVAHLEAGLRSFNRDMPEEINRVVTDHVSDILFCPSERGAWNLEREGITKSVHITGDVMFDALRWAMPDPNSVSDILREHGLKAGEYAIATVHRAENTNHESRLGSIIKALGDIATQLPVVLPAHPRTVEALQDMPLPLPPGITQIDPISHTEMLGLAGSARIGLTDSGGLQKELYWLGIPCVTMRDETEWVETVEAGWNVVAGTDSGTIVEATGDLMTDLPVERPPVYGDGYAADQIVQLLAEHLAPSGAAR